MNAMDIRKLIMAAVAVAVIAAPRSGASRSRLQPTHREDPIILHLGAGPAHYQKTINFVLHGRNQGPVYVYITDLGYGYLVIWVSRQQMGKMPAGRIV